MGFAPLHCDTLRGGWRLESILVADPRFGRVRPSGGCDALRRAARACHSGLGLRSKKLAHPLRAYGKAPCGISQTQKEETSTSQTEFPDAWDEGRVQRVLARYGEQTEDEALAEDEAGVRPSETVMNVPHELVSKVRELIAKPHG
jgi:hypothetical protein